MPDRYAQIFEDNARWASSQPAEYFAGLAGTQQPEFLYIGCSDSRVPAEEVTRLSPGDLFVHRNIGNIVAPFDLSSHSVVEYAIRHLRVKHVIVCGHTGCGGVRAAMQSVDMGILNPWLGHIRDVYRLHRAELDAITDQTTRYERLIELNALEQCFSIAKLAAFQQSYSETGFPRLHAWIYELHTGRLRDLPIDRERFSRELIDVYRVFAGTPPR